MPPIYRVIGMQTIRGNSANPNLRQTIFFNFDLDYSQPQAPSPTVVGTPWVQSFGPLGEFSLRTVSNQGYIGFQSGPVDSPVAEIDLLFTSLAYPPPPIISGQSWLYLCNDVSVCSLFFISPGTAAYGTACAEIFEVLPNEARPPHPGVKQISSR